MLLTIEYKVTYCINASNSTGKILLVNMWIYSRLYTEELESFLRS